MPAFRVKGSTGQAPTTVFFGAVPDKYNMLLSFYSYDTGSSHGLQVVDLRASATNINTWIPWDDNWAASGGSHITASLGATTTAPDGTNTAYHVTEGTNTGYHVMVAGSDDNQLLVPARRRFAAFVKAAERTRCWMQVGEYLGLTGATGNRFEGGVRCVFDLAGGQIGVPVAVFNANVSFPYNFTAVGAGITPFGNGWYLCYIDASLATNGVSPFNSSNCLQAVIGPDSGSGTGAISNSYTGNGTSGIYVWKTNMLPPRAYGMNNVTYFSDLTSISEVDVNNTLAPGFKWYTAGATWPGITYFSAGWLTPIPPGTLTVSGSVMTVPGGGGSTPASNVTSAAYTSGNNYVGSVFAPPFVAEWRGYFDYSIPSSVDNSDELAWWMEQLEYIINPANNNITGFDYQEIDTVDSKTAGGQYTPIQALLDSSPNSTMLNNTQFDFQIQPYQGVPTWAPLFPYTSAGFPVFFNGVLYISIAATTGDQPDISPSKWTVYTPTGSDPPNANLHIIDFNQMHLWTFIRIPDMSQYAPFDDTGIMMNFFDGIYCGNVGSIPGQRAYGASIPLRTNTNNSISQSRDKNHSMWILGSGRNRNIYTDYVRVYQ